MVEEAMLDVDIPLNMRGQERGVTIFLHLLHSKQNAETVTKFLVG